MVRSVDNDDNNLDPDNICDRLILDLVRWSNTTLGIAYHSACISQRLHTIATAYYSDCTA